MSFKNTIVGALIIGIFIVGVIAMVVSFQQENNIKLSTADNPALSKVYGNISKVLNESESTAQTQREALETESGFGVISTLEFVFGSIFAAGKVFTGVVVTVFNSIFSLLNETLGVPSIVTGTLLAILIIGLVLAAWRLYRLGE